jgi:hypothetical protein
MASYFNLGYFWLKLLFLNKIFLIEVAYFIEVAYRSFLEVAYFIKNNNVAKIYFRANKNYKKK